MKKYILILVVTVSLFMQSCDEIQHPVPQSTSGVSKATTNIQLDANGLTVEQEAIIERYHEDNKPGAIKHLYIISAYSGQVLIYSTVRGKVTSSGKRLSPSTIDGASGYNIGGSNIWRNNRVKVGDNNFITNEVLGDDGTYGPSVEYIYWWDSKKVYHQQYITGGMILHISNQPLAVKSVVLNMESVKEDK